MGSEGWVLRWSAVLGVGVGGGLECVNWLEEASGPGLGLPGTLGAGVCVCVESAPARGWKASQPHSHSSMPPLGLPILDSALPSPPGSLLGGPSSKRADYND